MRQPLLISISLMFILSSCNRMPVPEVQATSNDAMLVISSEHKKRRNLVTHIFQNEAEESSDAFFSSARSCVGNEDTVFVSTEDGIVQLSPDGFFIAKIGGRGSGPMDFRDDQGPFIEAVDNRLLILDLNRISYFRNDQIHPGFLLTDAKENILRTRKSYFQTSFTEDQILIPIPDQSQNTLATLYRPDGAVIKKISYHGLTSEYLNLSDHGDLTLWRHIENQWYCLFQFTPLLLIFDQDFNLTAEYHLDSPVTRAYEESYYIQDRAGLSNPHRNIALFSAFEIYNNKLFALTQEGLHGFSLQDFELESITYFNNGDHRSVIDHDRDLTYTDFTFLENGTLVLYSDGIPGEIHCTDASAMFAASRYNLTLDKPNSP